MKHEANVSCVSVAPSHAEWELVHCRILRGERDVVEEFVSEALPLLCRRMARRFPQTESEIVNDGVTDALLDYVRRPSSWVPAKGLSLYGFLHLAAWRNVCNLVHQRQRLCRLECPTDIVHEPYWVSTSDSGFELLPGRDRRKILGQVLSLVHDATDRQVLRMQFDGERDSQRFAAALGLLDLPKARQRKEVKRAKDRIAKVIQRGLKKGKWRVFCESWWSDCKAVNTSPARM